MVVVWCIMMVWRKVRLKAGNSIFASSVKRQDSDSLARGSGLTVCKTAGSRRHLNTRRGGYCDCL